VSSIPDDKLYGTTLNLVVCGVGVLCVKAYFQDPLLWRDPAERRLSRFHYCLSFSNARIKKRYQHRSKFGKACDASIRHCLHYTCIVVR
jgi:hypothetical protein